MATIKDVAKLAKVSIATVSHVINGTKKVEDSTKKLVLEAIKNCDYKVNYAARALKGKGSKVIGVISGPSTDPFFAKIIERLSIFMHAHNYALIIEFTEYETYKTANPYEILANRNFDAFLIHSIDPDDEIIAAANLLNKPTVLFHRSLDHPLISSIHSDQYHGFSMLINHLLTKGHRRIGHIRGGAYSSHSVNRRDDAYREILQAKGYFDEALIHTCNWSPSKAYEQTKLLMNLENRPTAIMYWSDTLALSGYAALTDLGLKIPEDCAVTGCDDIEIAQLFRPILTTLSQNPEELSKAIGELLLDRINQTNAIPNNQVLPVSIRIGGST